jgi:hypothetical protein
MRKFLLAAAAATTILAAGSANAMPAAGDITVDNPATKVAICFYLDGWNGPGFYDCGYRHRRGHGWHGKHRDGHHDGKHHSGKHHSGKHSSHHDGKNKKHNH